MGPQRPGRRDVERPDVPGWGADLRPEDRPGVPMEAEPRPAPGVHWTEPERQEPAPHLAGAPMPRPTPVFGTTLPPRGASGLLRRYAYRIPEHEARRWLLLLADRVDVVEHRVGEGIRSRPFAAAAAAVGLLLLARALRRRGREGG